MSGKVINSALHAVLGRSAPGGGFSEHSGSPYRPDATAWAVLALRAAGTRSSVLDEARSKLASEQLEDGRVCLAKDQFRAYWPTPLAILAWHGADAFRKNQDLAIQFLIKTAGKHWPKEKDFPVSVDTSIRGWPWTEDAFAWVEPTSLSIMALNACGHGTHERTREAVLLLLDRQISSGGWNYGNTVVYGQELFPHLESTGMALTALAGQVQNEQITSSLDYLSVRVRSCRTPFSLGWALLGLGSWGKIPQEARQWVAESLSRQKVLGLYGTSLISLLLLAFYSKGGFSNSLKGKELIE
jgi:hypothetical protein